MTPLRRTCPSAVGVPLPCRPYDLTATASTSGPRTTRTIRSAGRGRELVGVPSSGGCAVVSLGAPLGFPVAVGGLADGLVALQPRAEGAANHGRRGRHPGQQQTVVRGDRMPERLPQDLV